MELVHRTRNIRVAPRKLRLVAEKVKHMPAEQAISVLPLVNRGAAHHVRKSLQAAVQAAKDKNLDASTLVIQRIFCDEGPAMKRMVMHSHGRASTIMKKFSHLSIVLTGNEASRRRTTKAAAPEEPVTEEK